MESRIRTIFKKKQKPLPQETKYVTTPSLANQPRTDGVAEMEAQGGLVELEGRSSCHMNFTTDGTMLLIQEAEDETVTEGKVEMGPNMVGIWKSTGFMRKHLQAMMLDGDTPK